MKLLARDYEQAFSNCSVMLADGRPARIRNFEFPVRVGGETEVDTSEVQFIVDILGEDRRERVTERGLQFLMPPKKYGWFEHGNTSVFVSMYSQRQWRKGLTSRRLLFSIVRAKISEEGRVNITKNSTRLELDRSVMLSIFNARERGLGKAVGISLRRLKDRRPNTIAVINQDIAIAAVDQERCLAFYEDLAVGVYLPKSDRLVVHPANECFADHLRAVFNNITISENLEE